MFSAVGRHVSYRAWNDDHQYLHKVMAIHLSIRSYHGRWRRAGFPPERDDHIAALK